ncbi:hypothetical protein KR018_007974 [Drosophila ironensis]|nr:hypothetical protein KR018_007974 [Drosophila ironensis]
MPLPTSESATSVVDTTAVLEPESQLTKPILSPPCGCNIQDSLKAADQAADQAAGCLAEIHLSHKEITQRFIELLNLFEDYSRILDSESLQIGEAPLKLKQYLSEQQLTRQGGPVLEKRVSTSLMQLSDRVMKRECSQAVTCEVSSQTSWSALAEKESDFKDLRTRLEEVGGERSGGEQNVAPTDEEKPSKVLQHTIHIEVESVASATELVRPPLRERMWHVIVQTGDTILACAYMIGENFTYMLFISLCLWCLYLLMGHYYNFLQVNVGPQVDVKQQLGKALPK